MGAGVAQTRGGGRTGRELGEGWAAGVLTEKHFGN